MVSYSSSCFELAKKSTHLRLGKGGSESIGGSTLLSARCIKVVAASNEHVDFSLLNTNGSHSLKTWGCSFCQPGATGSQIKKYLHQSWLQY